MAYTPTTWTDEAPSTTPVKYQIIDDSSGSIANSATIAPVTSITGGTPFTAVNMNKIEAGIVAVEAKVDAMTFARPALAYFSGSGVSIPNVADTQIQFNNERYDDYGAFASNKYTALVTGVYAIEASVMLDSAAWTAGEVAILKLYFATLPYANIKSIYMQANGTLPVLLQGTYFAYIYAGQNISIYVYQNSGGAVTYSGNGSNMQTRLSVARIG